MAYTHNYYHILGLDAPGPASPAARPKSAELRRAYRTALLRAHPDKASTTATATAAKAERGQRGEVAGKGGAAYTVDHVREAFRVLDDPASRARYDAWVVTTPHFLSSSAGSHLGTAAAASGVQTLSADFVLGLDVLDLSDFRELDSGPEQEVEWCRACRCGEQVGFRIREEDLVDAEQRGEGEVLVGCQGCSLWVRVGFGVDEG
ncbi:uncharacterized protein M421DRAFT_60062 [Didymella exigua CBS 183.55]|uniref:Diphthamide biosynthesis protein 4 n=1 Tax=Didymella exigua CBS 183.55 TaxID=1150837 RepID=A0A6A5RT61_9PLEO|nr:uncharacterized protein M421DRAFT_60062 [Didymella exigua CBS 183.55]KAF1929526.1 hypothetical protein M421DRAFT_60062 [Didymella exigua CBS 183.55]